MIPRSIKSPPAMADVQIILRKTLVLRVAEQWITIRFIDRIILYDIYPPSGFQRITLYTFLLDALQSRSLAS